MRIMLLKGYIESPIDLDNEVWSELLRKIEDAVKEKVNPALKIHISELGRIANRPELVRT